MKGFRRDPVGFDHLATSKSVQKHMRFVGNYWQARLLARLPRLFTDSKGEYARNVQVSLHDKEIGGLMRTGARIEARVRYAAALEYGNAITKDPPRPLTSILNSIQAADPKRGKSRTL